MTTPEELIPEEWFETAAELTRRERKERVFSLIYGNAPNTQEMRDRISAYVNYGEPELSHIGTELHERVEMFVKGEQIHDPEQDGVVICKSMQWGPGCGHPVEVHLHSAFKNLDTDCHCCDGRRWDPKHIMECGDCQEHLVPKFERTIVGEPPLSRVEMREFKEEDLPPFSVEQMGNLSRETKTPEDMAEQLGCTVEELPGKIQGQIDYYVRATQQIQQMFVPPKMNRAQRRARDKQMRRQRGRG